MTFNLYIDNFGIYRKSFDICIYFSKFNYKYIIIYNNMYISKKFFHIKTISKNLSSFFDNNLVNNYIILSSENFTFDIF